MELPSKRSEQRAHVRVRMRLGLRLRGTEPSGKAFEEITTTEFTFESAWPVRGSASPANSRAAAVRVGAVLLFFQA